MGWTWITIDTHLVQLECPAHNDVAEETFVALNVALPQLEADCQAAVHDLEPCSDDFERRFVAAGR